MNPNPESPMSSLSRLISFAALVVASSLLSACSKDKNEDTSDEGTETDAYGCVVIGRTLVSDLSVPAEGFTFSAADALSSWSDDWVGTLAYVTDDGSEGDTVDASLEILATGDLEAVLSEAGETGMEYADEIDCGPRYETAAQLSLVAGAKGTDLMESFEGALGLQESSAALFGELPLADVQGALRPALVVDDYDEVWMSFYVSGEAGALGGTLGWIGEKTESSGDDGTVSAAMELIGTLSLGRSKRTE